MGENRLEFVKPGHEIKYIKVAKFIPKEEALKSKITLVELRVLTAEKVDKHRQEIKDKRTTRNN